MLVCEGDALGSLPRCRCTDAYTRMSGTSRRSRRRNQQPHRHAASLLPPDHPLMVVCEGIQRGQFEQLRVRPDLVTHEANVRMALCQQVLAQVRSGAAAAWNRDTRELLQQLLERALTHASLPVHCAVRVASISERLARCGEHVGVMIWALRAASGAVAGSDAAMSESAWIKKRQDAMQRGRARAHDEQAVLLDMQQHGQSTDVSEGAELYEDARCIPWWAYAALVADALPLPPAPPPTTAEQRPPPTHIPAPHDRTAAGGSGQALARALAALRGASTPTAPPSVAAPDALRLSHSFEHEFHDSEILATVVRPLPEASRTRLMHTPYAQLPLSAWDVAVRLLYLTWFKLPVPAPVRAQEQALRLMWRLDTLAAHKIMHGPPALWDAKDLSVTGRSILPRGMTAAIAFTTWRWWHARLHALLHPGAPDGVPTVCVPFSVVLNRAGAAGHLRRWLTHELARSEYGPCQPALDGIRNEAARLSVRDSEIEYYTSDGSTGAHYGDILSKLRSDDAARVTSVVEHGPLQLMKSDRTIADATALVAFGNALMRGIDAESSYVFLDDAVVTSAPLAVHAIETPAIASMQTALIVRHLWSWAVVVFTEHGRTVYLPDEGTAVADACATAQDGDALAGAATATSTGVLLEAIAVWCLVVHHHCEGALRRARPLGGHGESAADALRAGGAVHATDRAQYEAWRREELGRMIERLNLSAADYDQSVLNDMRQMQQLLRTARGSGPGQGSGDGAREGDRGPTLPHAILRELVLPALRPEVCCAVAASVVGGAAVAARVAESHARVANGGTGEVRGGAV